jgi:hypothetical protein
MWITNNLSWTRKFTFVRNCVCRYEGFFLKRNALKKIRNCWRMQRITRTIPEERSEGGMGCPE